MGFRITTNMMKNTYQYNLQNSTNKLADARDKVLTQRNFNSYAEDPAAATQAFRLRRDYYQTTSQIANTKDVYSKFNTGWQNIQGMLKDLINPMGKVSIIRGETDTAGESRTALAQILRSTADSMIEGFNQELGGHFIFAGNDGLNAPFTWKNGELFYRGVNVNSGGASKPVAREPDWMDQLEQLKASEEAAGTWETNEAGQAWYNYYTGASKVKPEGDDPGWLQFWADADVAAGKLTQEEADGWVKYYAKETDVKPLMSKTADVDAWGTVDDEDPIAYPKDLPKYPSSAWDENTRAWFDYYDDKRNLEKLKEMSEEEMYIDLGMGAEEQGANNPMKGTYFNSALSGLNFTNYGVDADGDPQNFALLLRELADVFDNWNENGQKYVPDKYLNYSETELKQLMEDDPAVAKEIGQFHEEALAKSYRLMDKLKAAQEDLTAANVELDARSAYLQTNQSRLELQQTNLNTEILDVEQVDLAAAITDFSWDMYCYNAALKIGNQLLSQSLIDYMR